MRGVGSRDISGSITAICQASITKGGPEGSAVTTLGKLANTFKISYRPIVCIASSEAFTCTSIYDSSQNSHGHRRAILNSILTSGDACPTDIMACMIGKVHFAAMAGVLSAALLMPCARQPRLSS